MAGAASCRGMGSRQPEFGQIVIKPCVQPIGGRVAAGTIGWEIAGFVIRICGAFKVLHVAAVAVRRRAGVTPGDVALLAMRCYMGSRQGKFRGRVIELCARPIVQAVTTLTIVTQAGLDVVRILGCVKVLHMTTETVPRSPCESIADVALNASERDVRAGQRISGVLRVIKSGTRPGVDVVTLVAGDRQPRQLMIRCPGRLILAQVARTAGSIEADKLAGYRSLVAGIAVDGGMRTE